jgi:hypothetical protein
VRPVLRSSALSSHHCGAGKVRPRFPECDDRPGIFAHGIAKLACTQFTPSQMPLDGAVHRVHVGAMARSLQRQLWDAFEESGLTFDQLLRLADLDLDRASLSRKLRGKQTISAKECEAIAAALRVVITTGKVAA